MTIMFSLDVIIRLKETILHLNIFTVLSILQGFVTMALSWIIFVRFETALLRLNDRQSKLILKASQSNIVRLRGIRDRLIKIGSKNDYIMQMANVMLDDLDCGIHDYESIRDYCLDLENRNILDRWMNAKQISIDLHEREARAKDPTHMINVSLSALFALIELGAPKPLVDISSLSLQ